MNTSYLPIKTLSFFENIHDSEIVDISHKILRFSKDTSELFLSPEQVITSIKILNIQNSTGTRVSQIQSNCVHLYSVIHHATPEDIPQDIWKTLRKRQTFLMLIIDDIYKTLREKNIYIPTGIPGYFFIETVQKTAHKDRDTIAFGTLCHYLSTDFTDGWKHFEYQFPHISRIGTIPQQ